MSNNQINIIRFLYNGNDINDSETNRRPITLINAHGESRPTSHANLHSEIRMMTMMTVINLISFDFFG